MALLFDQNQGSFQDTGSQRSPMKKNTGLMRKEMNKLDEVAPRGHTLAYITPEEAQILNRGGGGVDQEGNQMMGPYGVPMYPGYGSRGYQGAGRASGGDIGYGSQSNQSASRSNQSSNNNQQQQKQERPKNMPAMLSYEPPKKNFNTDNFMETVGNSIGGNKETINQGLLIDPGLQAALDKKEKGDGILERKGEVSNKIIEHLKTNTPKNEKEQNELLYVVDRFPNSIKNKIKKSVDDGEISLVAKPDKTQINDKIITGTSIGFAGANLTPKLSTPESMKPNPKWNMYNPNVKGGLHNDFGRLADELAMGEGFEGGVDGFRDAIRHTTGASYVYQGQDSSLARWLHTKQSSLTDDKTMNLWYAKGGPDMDAIKSSMPGSIDVGDGKAADAHNNTLGSSGIFDGLSFEERYEKVKEMTAEQLKHYSKTGEFKPGLPVWDTGKFPPEKAAEQLKTLEIAKEDFIDSKRMGLLSQPENRELSELEQRAEYQRDWRMTDSLNKITKLEDDIDALTDNLNNLKENNPTAKKDIKFIEESIKINKNNIKEEKKQIENRGGLKKLVFKKGIPVEESLVKALEEQNFLKAGNDWVLNIN